MIFVLSVLPLFLFAQSDSLTQNKRVNWKNPNHYSFITDIPSNTVGYIHQSFQKNNLYKIVIIAGATAILYALDPVITNAIQSLSRRNGISSIQNYDPVFTINTGKKQTNIGKLPRNFNTAIYNIGQGSTVFFIAAGLFIKGKISHDKRALTTASLLIQSFIALGAGTQILKYSTGRETSSEAVSSRGEWRPFPTWNAFQNNKSRYDAFPSGHMATIIAGITILSENYKEKKWIKPVGYGVALLCSLAMINNGVHWVSDYPLGFALGYGYGKFITAKNKQHLLHIVPL